MSTPQIKAGATLVNVTTKERLNINRVDLKGAYINGSKTPVPIFPLINKIKDRILVNA